LRCGRSGQQRDFGAAYEHLQPSQQAQLDAQLKTELRRNTYDAASGSISLSADRAAAVAQVAKHYADLFGGEPALDALREQYAMPANILRDAADRQDLTAFFFWSAWSAVTDRPGESNLSYTSNWPHEPLVGNTPTTGTGIWSIASVILMLGAIAAMIFFHSTSHEAGDPSPPKADPLFKLKATPSMLATRKYFYVVIALILAQVGMGVITAHYAVEGTSFFGHPARRDPALYRQSNHPHAVCRAVDRHRLAGHRPLHRAGDFRQRTEIPAPGRRCAVLCPTDHRRRVDGHRLAGHLAESRQRLQFLDRQPGSRVHQHGPCLADPVVRWPADLGSAARSRADCRRCANPPKAAG
jgi:hypothetical protein